jgi:hypothetical protein
MAPDHYSRLVNTTCCLIPQRVNLNVNLTRFPCCLLPPNTSYPCRPRIPHVHHQRGIYLYVIVLMFGILAAYLLVIGLLKTLNLVQKLYAHLISHPLRHPNYSKMSAETIDDKLDYPMAHKPKRIITPCPPFPQ